VERNCVIESTTTTGWWFMQKDSCDFVELFPKRKLKRGRSPL
jgi:hypothetical protein